MRVEDRMVSLQLRQVLDRLEEEDERQQEILRRRIDAERAALVATMKISRAAAVSSVQQEMELNKARDEARVARSQAALSSSCVSPELARGADEDGARLAEENRRLTEEVSALRVQIKEMSMSAGGKALAGGPGSPADQQRPALRVVDAVAGHSTHDDDSKSWMALIKFDTNTTDGASEPEGVDEVVPSCAREPEGADEVVPSLTGSRPEDGSSPTPTPREKLGTSGSERQGFSSMEEGACTPAQDGRVAVALPLAAASPPPNNDVSADDGVALESNTNGGGKSWDIHQLVEAEMERVLAELRADLPPSIKTLLQARGEMEACAASARVRLQDSGLLLPTAPSTGAPPVLNGSGLGGDESWRREHSAASSAAVRSDDGEESKSIL